MTLYEIHVFHLEGLRKTLENMSQDIHFTDRDSVRMRKLPFRNLV